MDPLHRRKSGRWGGRGARQVEQEVVDGVWNHVNRPDDIWVGRLVEPVQEWRERQKTPQNEQYRLQTEEHQ